ncbi:unnamed protein product [Alopecurus aequalis]
MAPRSWADLPVEWLLDIFRRVPCRADRRSVRNVCAGWREALMLSQPPPAPLPWLLITSGPVPTISCVLSKEAEHQVDANHAAPLARYFGSYDGAWVLGALNQTSDHVALHLRTGDIIDLPDVRRRLAGNMATVDVVILAATLSSAPDVPGCVAAGFMADRSQHSSERYISFWRIGDAEAVGYFELFSDSTERNHMIPYKLNVEDLIFHQGRFYFLTRQGEFRVCTTNFLQEGTVEANFESIYLRNVWSYGPDDKVLSRYLVESRGVLLMVLRCAPYDEEETTGFMVFKMVQVHTRADGTVEHDWDQLPHLDGRIIFLGRGCSRSYEASFYPGLEEGVYFLDDSEFCTIKTMFEADNTRKYLCTDNGKWSGIVAPIKQLSPASPEFSSYSSPIWLLP